MTKTRYGFKEICNQTWFVVIKLWLLKRIVSSFYSKTNGSKR